MQPHLRRVALALAVTVSRSRLRRVRWRRLVLIRHDLIRPVIRHDRGVIGRHELRCDSRGIDRVHGRAAGSGNDQVDAWAGEVCGAVGSWLTGINELGAQLGTDVQGIADLEEGRDLLVTFMEDVVGLTDDMLGSVEGAGAPDIERGDELAADLLAALQPVKTTFEEAVVEAQNLPTDDPRRSPPRRPSSATRSRARRGSSRRSSMRLQEEYDSPEINAAFESVPACADVG